MQAVLRKPSSLAVHLVLGAVLLAGLGLRTWNVRFDGGLNSHPDEAKHHVLLCADDRLARDCGRVSRSKTQPVESTMGPP